MGRIDRTGEEGVNNFGSKMIISRYNNRFDIDVYFPEYEYTIIHAEYGNFKKGNIKCPYERRVYGVGYIGEGKYKVKENGKTTKCYETWHSMLRRCYDEKYQEKKPTYKNCNVQEEFHNFQNFSKWFEENYYEIYGQKISLDKDILYKGNKTYSTQCCIFVPEKINSLFTKRQNHRGDLPIGVAHHKDKYEVCCNNGNGKSIYLGLYDTIDEAFQTYKIFKENIIKEVANEYKDLIPIKLYNALINYQVEIND